MFHSTVTNTGPRSCAVSEDGRQDRFEGYLIGESFDKKSISNSP
jgi:hypothetical protein